MDRTRIGLLMVMVGMLLGLSPQARGEESTLPWMQRPANVGQWSTDLPDFPRVTGLDEASITAKPKWDRSADSLVMFYFDGKQFSQAQSLMQADPAFAAGWDRLVGLVQSMMAEDGLGGLDGVKPETYVYKLGGRLLNLAFYYRMTGDKQAGQFLKAIAMDTAKRSPDFWMHKALRKYPADFPYGQLETAILARGMAPTMVWGRDLFSDSEYQQLCDSLRHKGLYPMLRYLETHKRYNNFLPAIASGAMCAAMALDEPVAKEHALALLNQWGALLQDDGSYGEQIDYFNYAFVNFAKGQLALGKDHVLQLGKQLPQLAGTLQWQLAHYALNDRGYPVRVNFGDDDFHGGAPSRLTTQLLALMTDNGLGTWMLDHMHGDVPTDDAYAMIAKIALNGTTLPKAVAPTNLPTVMGYDTGIGIIRSGWSLDQDTLIALRSGDGNRTRYSHDMPNRNALAMMFHGEYQLVEPGRASYRSPMRKTYDLVTKHHNTISIGTEIQPRDRKAQLLTAQRYDNVDILVSEAAESYREKPKHVRRSVYYLRELDACVVWDVVVLDKPESVSVNWHYGNDEGKSTLTSSQTGHWQLVKPRTQLDSWFFADRAMMPTQRDGIMHMNYAYFPGDENEGQWGNAFELELASEQPLTQLSAVSVFVPQVRKQALPVNISREGAAGDMTLTLNVGDQTSVIKLNANAIADDKQAAAQIDGQSFSGAGQRVSK